MATKTIQSDIFKFLALRPPVPIDKKNEELNFISDPRKIDETPVGKLTESFDMKDGTKIPEQLKNFIATNNYDLNYPETMGDFTLSKIFDLASSTRKEKFDSNKLSKDIENILGTSATVFLDNSDNQAQLANIWDRYYAFYILARTENQNLDKLTQSLRVFHLLQFISRSKINDFSALQNLLTARPVVSKIMTDLPKPIPAVQPDKPKTEVTDPETAKEYEQLWSRFVDTHRALEDIKNVRFETKLTSETKNIICPLYETGKEENSNVTFVKSNLAINKASFENLHPNSKSILQDLNLTEDNFQMDNAVSKLQNRFDKINLAISNINDPGLLVYMPKEATGITGVSSLTGKYAYQVRQIIPPAPETNIRASIKPLGIGDLKVVKQTLKKYVTGEVAHIENVLRGEYKERKNRVLDRTEDIFTVSNETNEETTKDTQTTDRFELKKESEKTVQEQMSVQAGVTVSASYGPVKFGAHGDFAYSTSSQESNKSSSNFAREVVDKSVSKIQNRTKEERTTKKLHEVEEINTHGIDNKEKPDNAIGIYRWVDKYYEAQIYNYGKRMMFEFIIPEPSSFIEYAQANKPQKTLIPPIIPYKSGTKEIITHKDITDWNYQIYTRDYNVQGVTPPPLPYKTISTAISKDGMPIDGSPHTANSKELIVPDGYISKNGVWFDCSAYFNNNPKLEVTIGNKIFRLLNYPGGAGIMDNNSMYNPAEPFHWFWPGNPIQISVNIYDIKSFTMNAYALVERTAELFEQWQIQTFEKIMAAYKAILMEYEQKSATQEVQDGITIHGQNPRINREIESTELKKHCLKMMMDTYLFGTFDAMKAGTPPDFDIFDAFEEGKTILFFEQAFEWENITYLFYPYFWGRKGVNAENWIHKVNTYDIDPLFTKFLQSGSARVVIPVHPAYNDAVLYFLENNGVIWKGGETPRLNDSMFISIADELRNQTDDLTNAIPEGDPWEVILPTTLVYLQKDSDLPTFP